MSNVASTVLALASAAALCACSSDAENPNTGAFGGRAGGTGVAGSTAQPMAGSGGAGGGAAPTAGQSAGGQSSAGANSGGTASGGGGASGGGASDDPLAVNPSPGCGQAPPQTPGGDFVRYTIETMGTKDASSDKAGPWTYIREYFIDLPADYDNMKPYHLVLQGPGCGGGGKDVFGLQDAGGGKMIRIGVSPVTEAQGTNPVPWNGCFDDKEGDDSIEWIFYEKMMDELKTKLCFDMNRVFASGNSSGSWWGNELACKYGSDTGGHRIRGIAVNTGGLPEAAAESPTCDGGAFAGMWMHANQDPANPYSGTQFAVEEALKKNKCTSTWDSPRDPYEVTGSPAASAICQKFQGCPAAFPVVLCTVQAAHHDDNNQLANPAFTQFILEN
jgi:hypothetical protein